MHEDLKPVPKLSRDAAHGLVVAVAETFADLLLSAADAFRDAPHHGAADIYWANVAKAGEDECWLWQGPCRGGYGAFSFDGLGIRAHRFAWALAHGPVPDGHVVTHDCGHRACQNPKHLRAVPARGHLAEMSRRGVAARQS